uniref:CCHC-type domain-containing protein n=1 Tax=Poecilia latipinna TaxID=48699 RepID=A0A3B3W0A9_9TELE
MKKELSNRCFLCTVVHGYEMRDEDGIRTGGRRFFVQQKRVLRTGETGHVFYPGQPKVCHRCGSQQHLSAECQSTHCKNCKNDRHLTKNCPYPVNCNLCGERGHIFKTCPKSYANRVKEGSLNKRNCTTSPKCPRLRCGDNETTKHLFWICPISKRIWSLMTPWLNGLSREEITYEKIVYGLDKYTVSEV